MSHRESKKIYFYVKHFLQIIYNIDNSTYYTGSLIIVICRAADE